MASKYHCVLIEGGDIVDNQTIDCENDSSALLEAGRILATSPFDAAEIWNDDRQVSIISRESPAA